MKQRTLLIIVVLFGCVFILWRSFDFQQTEKHRFNETQEKLKSLEKCFFFSQENTNFYKKHKKESLFLADKGWICPHNRLKVGKFLDKLSPSFQKLTYQCEPEEIKSLINHFFRISRITIET